MLLLVTDNILVNSARHMNISNYNYIYNSLFFFFELYVFEITYRKYCLRKMYIIIHIHI